MPAPTNTSKTDPLLLLLDLMDRKDPSSFIEDQEAQGQREMVASTTLPIDRNRWSDEGEQRWLDLGFTFGEVVDDLFQEATLPEGWKREGSDHSMWSYLVDERGIRRVGIFYKAAFYDRSAHMSIEKVGAAYSSQFTYKPEETEVPWDVLTADERADYIAGLNAWIENANQYPDIYDREDSIRPQVEAEIAARSASL